MCAGRNTIWTIFDLVWKFVRSADSFCPWLLMELPSWGKVTMSRMCLFLSFLSLQYYSVPNTDRAETLWGAEKRAHHLQFAKSFGSLNWKGWRELTWVRDTEASPSYFHCLFSRVVPGLLNRPLTFTLAQLEVAHHKELQGVCEVFHHWPEINFPLFNLLGKLQRKVFYTS